MPKRLDKAADKYICEQVKKGVSDYEIAMHLVIAPDIVRRRRIALGMGRATVAYCSAPKAPPTPMEIQERCLIVQRHRRAQLTPLRIEVCDEA